MFDEVIKWEDVKDLSHNLSFTCEIQDWMYDQIQDLFLERQKVLEKYVLRIMEQRFGVTKDEPEKMQELIKKKNLALCFDKGGTFYGITANNRWLYTFDGRVVGKSGCSFVFTGMSNRESE